MRKDIGLSRVDFDVYRFVASHLRCTMNDAADAIDEPGEIVRRSLRRLSEMGLVVGEEESEIQISPGGPELVFEILQEQIEHEYLNRRRAAADLRQDLTRILGECLLSDSPASGPPIEEFSTRKAAQVKLLELASHAREEVLRMWTHVPESMSRVADDEMVIGRAVRRGIGVRIICPTAFAGREVTQRLATVNGATVRTVVDPPIELHVFDRRVAVIVATTPRETVTTSFLVRGQPLTRVLHSVFETWWIHGQETCAVTDEQQTDLTGEDQALLQLLAKGVKDENAARQLGCSVRTVRRKVSELLDKLDSVSRFQAGVHAAHRQWV
ncbi:MULTISPECIES: LuxR C-terminal-related transcriptional regulator [Amycolatopsis]|uniref:LuxR C-terminal-related transcriptional regulator n=1 Tax=Amycolatopsis TaxID=1813 RepID=UPI00174D49DE|nr:LuxR C-terminal-related transcriptional regulator [Amycolatopsis bullii]